MVGFFTEKELESKSRPDGKKYTCVTCNLYSKCKTPKMQPYGNFKKKIMVIGEAPGEFEDKNGKPWQGRTGKLLQKTLSDYNIELFEDCVNINSVSCRPMDDEGENRTPSNFELEACRSKVLKVISEYNPKLIILLGNSAIYSLLGHRWKRDLGGITKWRGWTIPDQDFSAWICPTFHPSYIERSDSGVEDTIWTQDLRNAIDMLEVPFPKHKEPEIEIIEDLSVLNSITSGEIAFDYETTGLKPHAEGHRIVCCSIADSENHCYVFMMPKNRVEMQPFLNLLANPKIGKIAQNMKYEHTWSLVRLRTEVVNWVWDTMIASHIYDNRPGITSLKFQVYVQFGIVDYSSDVSSYLEATDNKNANAINKIYSLLDIPGGKEKLLKYCGYDSIYEFRLAARQRIDILPF